MKHKRLSVFLGTVALAFGTVTQADPADVGTIVDESGSMAGEQAWLPGMIAQLETELNAAGVGDATDPNRYATVGYGATSSHTTAGSGPHKHLDNGGSDGTVGDDWQAASDYGNTTPGFVTSGGFEDGWQAIDYYLNNYSFRADAANNVILATDEDRDGGTGFTFNGIRDSLINAGALLNAIVNIRFECGDGRRALGIDADGNGYVADGSGGFTTCTGASGIDGGFFNTSLQDYVNLALAVGGAAWDLNFLRLNDPLLASSFTNAFVDIKVKEIIEQNNPVPEPGTLALLGLGLIGVGATRRRKA